MTIDNRELKKKILGLLKDEEFEKSLEKICLLPARKAVNPLFSFLHHKNELIRWRAVAAMGAVVSNLAEQDIESARVVMRRLMWNLNDESGGIGWGSPEALGEVMARNGRMAEEYAHLLTSYVSEGCNFIEHNILQRGVLWGLGRLAHGRPHLVKHASPFLLPFMRSADAIHRGLASWTAGALNTALANPLLQYLTTDNSKIKLFIDLRFVEYTVGQLARKALSKAAPLQ
jgi:hypothetical protein